MSAHDANLSGGLQLSYDKSPDSTQSHSHSQSHSGHSNAPDPSRHLSPSSPPPHSHLPSLNLHLSPPSKRPSTAKAESVATYFNGFFQAIIGLSTLGASLTFSYVLSTSSVLSAQPPTATTQGTSSSGNNNNINNSSDNATPPPAPNPARFTANQVSQFLAISWLLFILSLALSSIFTTVLQFFHDDAVKWWSKGGPHKRVMLWYATLLSTLLTSLLLGAFIFLCLVVTALHPTIGWTALAFTCFLGLVSLLSIALRTPLGLVALSRVLRGMGRSGGVGGVIDTPGGTEGEDGGGGVGGEQKRWFRDLGRCVV
ncbi:MAG: hypothetical protein Q9160_007357 [Pyrenula sp. 1 TL-2023]